MGVNALFAYTICGAMGYSWRAALASVLISGVIFLVISVTGLRQMVIDAIPVQLKLSGPAELIGPEIVGMQGGMCGTYVKSIGKTGKATLTVCDAYGREMTEVDINIQMGP